MPQVQSGRVTRPAQPETPPEASARYTPKKPTYRLRPRWHRLAGWVGVVLGIAVIIANDAMLIAQNLSLLPGGHTEVYLLVGLLVGGSSTWFLGLFDRGATIYSSGVE